MAWSFYMVEEVYRGLYGFIWSNNWTPHYLLLYVSEIYKLIIIDEGYKGVLCFKTNFDA